jgi:hypothetical protein
MYSKARKESKHERIFTHIEMRKENFLADNHVDKFSRERKENLEKKRGSGA